MAGIKLPSGWKAVRFGDVVRQVKDRIDPESSGLERYVAGEHMDTDDVKIRRWGTIGDGYLGPAFHMRFKPGQVLYGSRRTYLRKVAVADFDGICANTTFVVEPSTPELLAEFLPLVMTTEAFHAHSIEQSKGSVNPYINYRDLTWFEFALPPPAVQAQLVRDLATARDAVNASERRIVTTSTALDALAAAALRDPASAAGHSTPLVVKQVDLRTIASLRRGRFSYRPRNEPRLYAVDGPFPFVQTGDIQRADRLLDDPTQYLSEAGIEYSRCVPAGTLLTTIAAVIGATAYTTRPTYLPDSVVSIEPTEKSHVGYLELLIRALRPSLEAHVATENTQKNLSIERLGSVQVPLVPLPVQSQVATRAEALWELLASAKRAHRDLVALTARLRDRSLTGALDVQ